MQSRILTSLVVTAALCSAGTSLADDQRHPRSPASQGAERAQEQPKDHADALFDQGLAAFDAGKTEEARAKFEAAWALKKTHDIAGNLGIAELKLGRARDAAEHLAYAVRNLPPSESDATRDGLQKKFKEARAQVGAIRVRVNVDQAEVSVNGRSAGRAPLADDIYVEPGAVKVAARRDGYMAAEQAVTIAKGEARDVALALAPIGDGREGPTVPGKRSPVPAIVAGGVAVGALAVGIGLSVASNGKYNHMLALDNTIDKDHGRCVGPGPIDPRCTELINTARDRDTFNRVAIAAFVGAGVLVAGGLTYLLWPAPKAKKGGTNVYATPILGAGYGGTMIRGAF